MIGFGGSFTHCQDFTDILVSLLGCFLQGPRHLQLLSSDPRHLSQQKSFCHHKQGCLWTLPVVGWAKIENWFRYQRVVAHRNVKSCQSKQDVLLTWRPRKKIFGIIFPKCLISPVSQVLSPLCVVFCTIHSPGIRPSQKHIEVQPLFTCSLGSEPLLLPKRPIMKSCGEEMSKFT